MIMLNRPMEKIIINKFQIPFQSDVRRNNANKLWKKYEAVAS